MTPSHSLVNPGVHVTVSICNVNKDGFYVFYKPRWRKRLENKTTHLKNQHTNVNRLIFQRKWSVRTIVIPHIMEMTLSTSSKLKSEQPVVIIRQMLWYIETRLHFHFPFPPHFLSLQPRYSRAHTHQTRHDTRTHRNNIHTEFTGNYVLFTRNKISCK